MTLRDLENQRLLWLPSDKEWACEDVNGLRLQRVQMWGYEEGNDDGIRLFCLDDMENVYEAEITFFSECLSRAYMSQFLTENYGERLSDIYARELEIKDDTTSIFAHEFIAPYYGSSRWRESMSLKSI